MRSLTLTFLLAFLPGVTLAAASLEDLRALRDRGDYDVCVAAATPALESPPDDPLAEADLLDVYCYCRRRDGSPSAEETLHLARRAVSLREAAAGPDHPSLAPSLRNLGRSLWDTRQTEEALATYRRALAVDPGNPVEAGRSEIGIANLLRAQRDYEAAEAAYLRAIERLAGHPSHQANARNSYRRLLAATDRDDEALEQARAALALQDTVDPDHPNAGIFAAGLAKLLEERGELEEAQTTFERALRVAQRMPDHPRLGYTYRDLGRILVARSEFEAAAPHLETAGELLFRREDHALAGVTAWQMLADTYLEMYRFEEAASLLDRAYRERTERQGPDHPAVATTATLLGKLHRYQGDHQQALAWFEEALRIRQARYGDDSRRVAETLLNVADAHWYLGDAERASELSQTALRTGALRGEAWGFTAINIARYALDVDDLDLARTLLDQVRPIFEEDYDAASLPRIALESVAGQLAEREGDLAAAEAFFRRSVQLREELSGDAHPMTGVGWETVAIAQWLQGDPVAFETALRAESITRAFLRLSAGSLPDRQALRVRPQFYAGLDTALRIALDRGDDAQLERAAQALFASRALVLDAVGRRRQQLLRAEDDAARAALEELREARRALARAALSDARNPGQLDRLRREKERLELRAARGVSVDSAREETRLAQVRAALPTGAALVSFARVTEPSLRKQPGAELVALVTTADTLRGVRLGDTQHLQELVERWRADLLAGWTDGGEAHRASGAAVRAALWDPLVPGLDGAERVFLVPDGPVHGVAFAALPQDEDRYVLDDGRRFHRLGAERDLLAPSAGPSDDGSMLLVGNPAFSPAPKTPAGCDLASLHFEPLPATSEEVRAVSRRWTGPVRILTGADANEASFKADAPGRRVLHLATHGFFLGDTCGPGVPGTRGIGSVVRRPSPTTARIESPLLRCGLAFAGANAREGGAEDGVLLAEEILNLDLNGVDWAVLSACDTGAGAVERGEGVVGLQRAFTLAGTRTVIMSLWSVQDEASRDWMRHLYDARWGEDRSSTMDAVFAANQRSLRERRRRGVDTSPFFWAAFVSAGDWR